MSIRPQWWMTLQAFTFPLAQKLLRESQRTLLGRLSAFITIPLLSGKNFHITYLPVNEEIAGTGSTPLPKAVLEEIIVGASHRAIIKRCTCRDGNNCTNHPVELGCLLLGDGAREISKGVSRHVDVDEALDHAAKCIENGLVPFAGRFKADNIIWGVRDRGKLLTVCFCCHCCCIIRNSVRYLPEVSRESLVRLKGLRIETDPDACTGCGICVAECFVAARSLAGGKALCDAATCKGCGRCITVCPTRAVSARVENLWNAVDDMQNRIGRLIDYR